MANATKRKTGKPKSEVGKCPKFENCEIRLGTAETRARIVSLIHLGARAFYTSIGWFVIGKGIGSSFFVSLFLFVFPILMDCIYYGFVGRSRKSIIAIETIISVLWALCAVLGLSGVVIVTGGGFVTFADDFIGIKGAVVSTQCLWWLLSSVPFITWVDFSSRYSIKEESKQAERREE